MQKKPPILLIAIVLGLIALGGTALLLTRDPAAPKPDAGAPGLQVAAPAPTPIPEMRYIANRDIPPRTLITSDMMRRSEISGPRPLGAITSLDDVRGMITKKTIRSGDTVTRDSLIEPIDRVIPANFTIPSGFRAVAIYVNPQQTAAGLVDVGDRVDVIATQKLTIDKQPNQYVIGSKDFTTGRTIGTNLLVLAVDQSLAAPVMTPAPTDAAGNPAPGAAAPGTVDVVPPPGQAAPAAQPAPIPPPQGDGPPVGDIRVVLAAPLETSSRLVAANDSGTLHIVVRNPLDGDSERAPETREYPSRTIAVAQPKTASSGSGNDGGSGGGGGGGGSSGGGGGNRFPVPELPDVTVSQSVPPPTPLQIPAMPAPESGGVYAPAPVPQTPAGPQTRDVMVVRGTEKTRVIVPKR